MLGVSAAALEPPCPHPPPDGPPPNAVLCVLRSYGFIPKTLCEDADPLDVLVLMQVCAVCASTV